MYKDAYLVWDYLKSIGRLEYTLTMAKKKKREDELKRLKQKVQEMEDALNGG